MTQMNTYCRLILNWVLSKSFEIGAYLMFLPEFMALFYHLVNYSDSFSYGEKIAPILTDESKLLHNSNLIFTFVTWGFLCMSLLIETKYASSMKFCCKLDDEKTDILGLPKQNLFLPICLQVKNWEITVAM